MCGCHGQELQGVVDGGSKNRGGGFEGMFVAGTGVGLAVGSEFGFVLEKIETEADAWTRPVVAGPAVRG